MKQIVLTSLIFVAIAATGLPAQSFSHSRVAAMPLRLSVRPDSRLWLEGSSNLRDWRCDATTKRPIGCRRSRYRSCCEILAW